MSAGSLPKIEKLSPSKQQHLNQLLDQNCEGTLSSEEKEELEQLVEEAEKLMVRNAGNLAGPCR